jgi:hypothetical protein
MQVHHLRGRITLDRVGKSNIRVRILYTSTNQALLVREAKLGDLIRKLKYQLKLTSIVFTHDMRFAHFFGIMAEMQESEDPVIRSSLPA